MTVFNTPARQAAIEALDYCARPEFAKGRTVLWSFGSGAFETRFRPGQADRWYPWNWASRLFRDVQSDAESDQVYGAIRMAGQGEIEFRRYQVTIGESTLGQLGYSGAVPDLPIELDRAEAGDFLDEVGRLFAIRIDWSDPQGYRLPAPSTDPLSDRQLWRSGDPRPGAAGAKRSARMT
jgi:hypothetical protein